MFPLSREAGLRRHALFGDGCGDGLPDEGCPALMFVGAALVSAGPACPQAAYATRWADYHPAEHGPAVQHQGRAGEASCFGAAPHRTLVEGMCRHTVLEERHSYRPRACTTSSQALTHDPLRTKWQSSLSLQQHTARAAGCKPCDYHREKKHNQAQSHAHVDTVTIQGTHV